MTQYRNSGEGGTAGSAVTTGNSGGTSGTAFTAVSGLTYKGDWAAHGALSIGGDLSASTAGAVGRWSAGGTDSTSRGRLGFGTSAVPTADQGLARLTNAADSASLFTIYRKSTGVLAVINAAGSTRWTGTVALPIDLSKVRIEWRNHSTGTSTTDGTLEVAWYLADSTTASDTSGALTGNYGAGATIGQIRMGKTTSDSFTGSLRYDDLAVDTGVDAVAGAWLGPVITPTPAVVTVDPMALTVAVGPVQVEVQTSIAGPDAFAITVSSGQHSARAGVTVSPTVAAATLAAGQVSVVAAKPAVVQVQVATVVLGSTPTTVSAASSVLPIAAGLSVAARPIVAQVGAQAAPQASTVTLSAPPAVPSAGAAPRPAVAVATVSVRDVTVTSSTSTPALVQVQVAAVTIEARPVVPQAGTTRSVAAASATVATAPVLLSSGVTLQTIRAAIAASAGGADVAAGRGVTVHPGAAQALLTVRPVEVIASIGTARSPARRVIRFPGGGRVIRFPGGGRVIRFGRRRG